MRGAASGWSGRAMAAALVGSSAIVVMLSTKVKVDPSPPDTAPAAVYSPLAPPRFSTPDCSPAGLQQARLTLARMVRHELFDDDIEIPYPARSIAWDEIERVTSQASNARDYVAWRTGEIAKIRRGLVVCGESPEVRACLGYGGMDTWRLQVLDTYDGRLKLHRLWRERLLRLHREHVMCGSR